jgi:hypothetical protein
VAIGAILLNEYSFRQGAGPVETLDRKSLAPAFTDDRPVFPKAGAAKATTKTFAKFLASFLAQLDLTTPTAFS